MALFNAETKVLTQSAIARTMDLNMTSTYRYINTLVELGYLEKNVKTKQIRPAPRCLQLCINLMRSADHLRMIKGVIDRLHAEYNISIDMAYAVDNGLVRIYNREAEETFTYSLPDFSRNCLHNTALGKAYLSSLPDDRLVEKLERMDLVGKTDRTIVDKEALLAEIKKIKLRRFAMTEEEYLPGLLAIGAPLHDPVSGEGVGAVSFDFSVLQHDSREIMSRYGALIIETAATLSQMLPPDRRRP